MHFDAPWDAATRWITIGALGVCIAAGLVVARAVLATDQWVVRAVLVVAAAPALLAVPALYLWSPRSYLVEDREIVIQRPIGPVRIPLKSVRGVKPLDASAKLLRTFGVGGVFGFYGSFREASLGPVSLYASRGAGRIVVLSSPKPVVISPEPPEAFLAEVEKRLRP